jgi:hypothetical protein
MSSRSAGILACCLSAQDLDIYRTGSFVVFPVLVPDLFASFEFIEVEIGQGGMKEENVWWPR